MKGIIFNVLEDFAVEKFGDETLEEVYSQAELSEGVPPFVGPASYPDQDLVTLVTLLSEKGGVSVEDLLHSLGEYAISILARRFPLFFEGLSSAKEFLKTMNEVHYLEVRKLYSDANPPKIVLEDNTDGKTYLHYRSPRRLCSFLEGLLEGTGKHFGEGISYRHLRCQKEGAEECILELNFSRG